MITVSPAPVFSAPAPAAPPTAISLAGIEHTYQSRSGSQRALARVDLAITQGEFVALIGPSGCGKSTLLRILSGLLEPTAGQVLLDDQPTAAARHARAIGWLAQDDGLLPWLSVFDNARLPLRLAGRGDGSSALDLLAAVDLSASVRRYPHELSGGMRQRVALARALVGGPSFLLLDEPFAHLDELTRERLGDLLLDLRGAAQRVPTTMLVTHSVAEAVRLADRVIVMSPPPGRVVLDCRIDLPHPRREEDPAFGTHVARLKTALLA